jgi:hypothetical protein
MSDLQKTGFFSPQNEAMLDRLLYNDFQRRIGGDLSEKQKERLVKTVRHYMNEVYEDQGSQPVPQLNKEVLAAVVPDYLSYLRRGQIGGDDKTRADVGNRFNQLQTERQEVRSLPPAAPDFRITSEEAGSTALSLFEQVKKQREEDAMRSVDTTRSMDVTYTESRTVNQSVEASVHFNESSDAAKKRDELALTQRTLLRQAAQRNTTLVTPPDPRAFFFGTTASGLDINLPQPNQAQGNPTTALPDAVRTRTSLPQDLIKKEDDIVSYRENEYNLFLYSSDRNWTVNSTENRYNFSVNFDPANNRNGVGFSTAANIKFKNIVRIELVKVILPTEGIDIIARQVTTIGYDTDLNVNILSFPYLLLRIPELDTNNFGTNNNIDNSFGIIQYDGNWVSDNLSKNRGYLAMIPKFMKCQKVYYPTPLATLQKLTIQLQRPDGNLISSTLDTVDISGFMTGSQIVAEVSNQTANIDGTLYATDNNNYLWIQTKTWFSKFMISQGDRIVFKNLTFQTTYTANATAASLLEIANAAARTAAQRAAEAAVIGSGPAAAAASAAAAAASTSATAAATAAAATAAATITPASIDFLNFIQKTEGHMVVDVGTKSGVYYTTGSNQVGYCNFIIIRNNYADPTTGSTSIVNYGGSNTANTDLYTRLTTDSMAVGRVINMNHQTQVVLRVITRDLDTASRLRPDNNF